MTTPLTLHTRDGEPRVLDTDLAERLGMAVPANIRKDLIRPNMAELQGFGSIGEAPLNPGSKGGRPGRAFYLNEEQALLLVMFSRTLKAVECRREIIRVFLAYRWESQAQRVHGADRGEGDGSAANAESHADAANVFPDDVHRSASDLFAVATAAEAAVEALERTLQAHCDEHAVIVKRLTMARQESLRARASVEHQQIFERERAAFRILTNLQDAHRGAPSPDAAGSFSPQPFGPVGRGTVHLDRQRALREVGSSFDVNPRTFRMWRSWFGSPGVVHHPQPDNMKGTVRGITNAMRREAVARYDAIQRERALPGDPKKLH